MRNALLVFDALASPGVSDLSRVEIEQRTGLLRDEVLEGLRSLKRHQKLLIAGVPRQRARYSLVPNATRPIERRGGYVRTGAHRTLQTTLRLAALGRVCLVRYSVAAPPSHAHAPGAARLGRAHRITVALDAAPPPVLGLAGLLKWKG